MKTYYAILVSCLVIAGNALASEVHYRESIKADSTFRITRSYEDSILTLWEASLPGDSLFGQPADTITYYHSVEQIDPPLLPDGVIRLLRLKLQIRDGHNRDLSLTVDSVGLGRIHKRHFLIGPGPDDWLNVNETILADGQIMVTLVSEDGDSDIDDDNDDGHSDDIDDHDDNGDESEDDGDDDSDDHQGDDGGISGSVLDDGLGSEISLCPTRGKFVLKKSVMDVVYLPAIPMSVTDPSGSNPENYFLLANYPNPFNPSTTIEYNLPTRSQVRVEVLNALGQTVRVLIDAPVSAGPHQVVWDGHNQNGLPVASGIYYYRIAAGDLINARKMILLK